MMDTWQDTWNLLNDKLSEECCNDLISEEEMEYVLDKCQLMEVHELVRYYKGRYGQTEFDELE